MFEHFAGPARAAIENARVEAARRGSRRIGTEDVLTALVADERLARLVGADSAAIRGAAETLDRSALAAVGFELGDDWRHSPAALGKRTPLSAGTKAVLQSALLVAKAERAKQITRRHLLMALLTRRRPDPATTLLDQLGVDIGEIHARLVAEG
ncbi:Clp protease N-terminal domain-containing protein [Humibacter ginsenosidimutans]|uniref:Clp protease n=1 Tax=Humibacter ginsenosidimutans TaxID=2599293 RepID=A0A5B8M694_9MICO|nr:Clp protease N-terminal domain-containing protein [Humibacter ginsenosidimutans]QDZ16127.1 Clp protease [Humibacter ginsenosidimutans]